MKKKLKKKQIKFSPRIEKKIFQPKNGLLKNNLIPIAGNHAVLSALQNKNRKLHYLMTVSENHSKWGDKINKLKLKLNIKIKSKEELDEINNYKPHQNIVLITEPLQRLSMDEFLLNCKHNNKIPIRLIILDEVTERPRQVCELGGKIEHFDEPIVAEHDA